MKRFAEFIKPFVSIILGALLFLYFLNWLSLKEGALAIGIIATVLAVYYLTVGILGVLLGEKMPNKLRKSFDIASIVSFPIFMFTYFLIMVIANVKAMGPTGWVIAILSMVVSISLGCIYLVSKLVNNKLLTRFSYLFAVVFTLVLLVDIVFDQIGNPIVLGNIDIIRVAIYAVYTYMLFISLKNNNGEEKVSE